MGAFYFKTISITRNNNGKYKFVGKCEILGASSVVTPIPSPGNVSLAKELAFDITDETKSQDCIFDDIDFTNYERHDLLHVLLTKNGLPYGRDPKGEFVVKNTKYPPPDKQSRFLPLMMSEKKKKAQKFNIAMNRFMVHRIFATRIGDGIYTLELDIIDTNSVPEYIASDYRAVYDDTNHIVAIALFIEIPSNPAADPPKSLLEFNSGLHSIPRNFDLNTIIPIVIVEKINNNYLDIDWMDIDLKIASINFD